MSWLAANCVIQLYIYPNLDQGQCMDDSYVHWNRKLWQANRRRITTDTHQRASICGVPVTNSRSFYMKVTF